MKYDFIYDTCKQLRKVMKDGFWGVINEQGDVIIPIVFDKVPLYCYGGHFICEKENKQGLYDIAGKEILPVECEVICRLEDCLFCSIKGDITTVHDLEKNFSFELECDNVLPFSKEYLIFEKNDMQGLVDRKGKVVINPEYASIERSLVYAVATDTKNKIHVYNLKKNKWTITGEYNEIKIFGENCICVRDKKKRFGFVDSNGTCKIECKYTTVKIPRPGDKIILVFIKDKCGIVDLSSNEIIPVMYQDLTPMRGGALIVKSEGRVGIVNKSNQIKLPIKYEQIKEGIDGFILVEEDGKKGLLDLEYKTIIPPEYEDICILNSNVAKVSRGYFKQGLYNLKTGKILCDTIYHEISYFHEGLAAVLNAERHWGYLDEAGNEVIACKYHNAGNFKNGYAVVSKGYNEHGYINKAGEELTDFIYFHASEVDRNGMARVSVRCGKTNERWKKVISGAINLKEK